MLLAEAGQVFMLRCKVENLSKDTLRWYHWKLGQFFGYVRQVGIERIEQINATHIRDFILHCRDKNNRAITLKGHVRALKTFFKYLHDEEYIEQDVSQKVKIPKVENKLMRTFTREEINRMLSAFDTSTYIGLRNYVIMVLLFDTGVRRAEVINIRIEDVNLEAGLIKVYGKGKKERVVPVGKTGRKVLLNYLKKNSRQDRYLFTNNKGEQLTVAAITNMFAKMKKKIGLTGERISPHTWRHTFAKEFLLNGGDLFSLQQILGHTDLATTRRYVSLNTKEIKTQHAKFNPLDNKELYF